MRTAQNTKRIIALRPQLKDNGAFANNTYWDRSGFSHERVEFIVGDTDAAVGSGDAATPPFVEECDITDGSYTAVTGAALSAVIGTTDGNKSFAIDVDLAKSHKRYGKVNAPTADDGTTGANMTIIVTLSRPSIGPKDAAGQGLEELVTA